MCTTLKSSLTVNVISAGVLLSLSAPLVYDKYQDSINPKLFTMLEILRKAYRKIDDNILKKIPILNKEKKID